MAFTAITSGSIDVGDPLKKELFDTIKSNFDDHETRINNVEAGSTRINVMKFDVRNASSFPSATGLYYYEADSTFSLSECYIRIYEKGSLAGVLEIDIKKSTTDLDNASFTSIFTTKPSITYASASDYDASTNQVLDAGAINIAPGDFLRFDITQAPTGGVLSKFLLTLYGE